MVGRVAVVFGSMLVACATSKGKQASSTPPAESDLPAMVAVEAQTAELGLWQGRLHQAVAVPAFSITKHPITRGSYDACVTAGACPSAPGDCQFRRDGEQIGNDSKNPASCVGIAGAKAFCAWIGGKLPTPEQWLLAARGSKTARFAWGDKPANCARHPLGRLSLDEAGEGSLPPEAVYSLFYGQRPEPCVAEPGQRFRVGQHRSGASPTGLEDVLLTSAELLAPVDKTLFAACRSPRAGCLVQTEELAGSIDSISTFRVPRSAATASGGQQPTRQVGAEAQLSTDAQNPEYGFRCVQEASL